MFVRMDKIPIEFEHKGKRYSGSLDAICGAGGNTWYLMINNYYYGRLRVNERGWFFDGNMFNELADYFGEYMIAWCDSRIEL
jgi:hypothetical protein